MQITLTTVRRDGNLKREWTFVTLSFSPFEFMLDRFVELRREGNRGRFKMEGKWQRLDQRQNTINPPCCPSVLLDELRKEIAKKITIRGIEE